MQPPRPVRIPSIHLTLRSSLTAQSTDIGHAQRIRSSPRLRAVARRSHPCLKLTNQILHVRSNLFFPWLIMWRAKAIATGSICTSICMSVRGRFSISTCSMSSNFSTRLSTSLISEISKIFPFWSKYGFYDVISNFRLLLKTNSRWDSGFYHRDPYHRGKFFQYCVNYVILMFGLDPIFNTFAPYYHRRTSYGHLFVFSGRPDFLPR